MRRPLGWLATAILCSLTSQVAGQGTVDIQTTPFDQFVVVDVTIVDSGTGSGCTEFVLERSAFVECASSTVIATIPRQTGTRTLQFFDGPLSPNTAYEYDIWPCSGFSWAGDCGWGLPIVALTMTTGPGSTPVGHGFLRTSGTPWWLMPCGGMGCWGNNIVSLPPEADPYVNTDTPVMLYGTFTRNCQWSWFTEVTRVVPSSCTVDIAPETWGSVKRLYR